jgi:hypothetical protein
VIRPPREQRLVVRPPPTHRGPIVIYLTDFCRAPRGTHDFGRTPCDTYDSTRATRVPDIHDSASASSGSGIPALLVSPSGYVRATSTASSSAIATGEGCTGGPSGQPSSDDHACEAGFPATGQQTYIASHLIITAIFDAHLRPSCPH